MKRVGFFLIILLSLLSCSMNHDNLKKEIIDYIFFLRPDDLIYNKIFLENENIAEVDSDFGFNTKKAQEELIKFNITCIYTTEKILKIIIGKSNYIINKDNNNYYGYLLATENKKPVIEYGIFSSDHIISKAKEYFGIKLLLK